MIASKVGFRVCCVPLAIGFSPSCSGRVRFVLLDSGGGYGQAALCHAGVLSSRLRLLRPVAETRLARYRKGN